MEIQAGTLVPPLEISSVSSEKMKTMAALLSDPNPIHWDTPAVQALGMGDRPVNQGPSNMAYVMTMLTNWAGGYDRLRSFKVRFVGNILAGDHLFARGVVSSVSDVGGERLVDCDVRLETAEGVVALKGTATVVVAAS